jgi:hypothetical protein
VSWDGALRFARYAVPPNGLGYCGPNEHDRLLAYRSGELAPDAGLRELATGFEGAWPYLELLAGIAGTDDPLDDRVVQAYWIGHPVLDRVDTNEWGWHLADRFGPRAGRHLDSITAGVGIDALPNHAFHVLCVYPWVGMLRAGRGGGTPLAVIEQCRISWGTVGDLVGDAVTVAGPELTWSGSVLALAPVPATRLVACDRSLIGRLHPGATVAVHWNTVCDILDPAQASRLAAITNRTVRMVNRLGTVHLIDR